MDQKTALRRLKALSDPKVLESHARFGDTGRNKLGVATPEIRRLAREIGKDHLLAIELWKTNIHEARVLATMIDHPDHVTDEQMEKWVSEFDGWGICDHACGNLFDRTKFAYKKAAEWTCREREYEKRAGFALIAYLAVHDKKSPDSRFLKFLPIIKKESGDDRNFVKKAANWALREIGKRNAALNKAAIETAKEIRASGKGKWIAYDALRELQGDAVQERLSRKSRTSS